MVGSILKVFLIALRKRRKTLWLPIGSPRWGCRWWVSIRLVLCYRDEYKLALGEQRGDFHVLLVNEWLAQEINARLRRVAANRGARSLARKSRLYPARAPAQWAAIFVFGAKAGKMSA